MRQARRTALLRQGRLLETTTLLWNVVGLGVLGVSAAAARSVALLGFGLDSLIEIGGHRYRNALDHNIPNLPDASAITGEAVNDAVGATVPLAGRRAVIQPPTARGELRVQVRAPVGPGLGWDR